MAGQHLRNLCKNSFSCFDRPPPQGSVLWRRLVVLGQTALMYGQIAAARECWAAAGYWRGLLPLNALSGDFTSISAYIRMQQKVLCGSHYGSLLSLDFNCSSHLDALQFSFRLSSESCEFLFLPSSIYITTGIIQLCCLLEITIPCMRIADRCLFSCKSLPAGQCRSKAYGRPAEELGRGTILQSHSCGCKDLLW